jgi:hypothetical protein
MWDKAGYNPELGKRARVLLPGQMTFLSFQSDSLTISGNCFLLNL